MPDHYFYFFAGKDELFGVDRADCVVVDIAVYAAGDPGEGTRPPIPRMPDLITIGEMGFDRGVEISMGV